MRQAFSAIKYLHNSNIAHRDIKPENFLLFKENDADNIKLIDFGLSKKLSENEIMHNPNGTAYYIAPEVLNGEYDQKCDIWSIGVVLYILMCGRPPFKGKSNPEIIKSILKGEYKFNYPSFDGCTDECKDFIKQCLTKDPKDRFSAEEAFHHEWLKQQWDKEQSELTIPDDIVGSIKNFMHAVNFKKTTITFMASRIPEDQIAILKNAFVKLDRNGDGILSKDELIAGVSEIPGCNIREEDWDLVIQLMDTNKNGYIDYTEFIAGCMQSYVYLNESNLQNAFSYFDKDGNGTITVEELRDTLGKDNLMLSSEDIEQILNEVDINDDGVIDYKEFLKMMRSEHVSRSMSKLIE